MTFDKAEHSKKEMVKLLLAKAAEPCVENYVGETSLDVALNYNGKD